MKYLGAVTEIGPQNPEFMNFSQDGHEVVLTARSPASRGSQYFTMRISSVTFGLMLADINKNFK